ncbi:L-threonylcarbamoyladenylate synthase [Arsenicicoccus dermatophilus]|uniref:L-threonylcarbamoyladenylate synthase n=1 Tax=Arsenicicoccus dermatophilus TaxID=1076331 RepID=UPI00391700CC
MSETYDCTSPEGLEAGLTEAAEAVRRGQVVVLPTDTVYGVGGDAFNPEAVRAVLAAKGRGLDMPPPVLVPHARTVDGLAVDVPAYARDLMERFWPGALTLVLIAQPSLMWDLGETNGTVALRIPRDETALALLTQVGPMAVTSANTTGLPAALSCAEAEGMLGEAVAVYLDGGACEDGEASTILDCTQSRPRILRHGAVTEEQLREALGEVRMEGDEEPSEQGGGPQATDAPRDSSADAALQDPTTAVRPADPTL